MPGSAGGLGLTGKVLADELQTILGRGTRIGMAIPNEGSTGNGRNEEKSVEEGYGAERCHLYKRSRVGLRADWHLGSCLEHNVDKMTRILYTKSSAESDLPNRG